ncbi:MaoC/PaaZ C-terminal domain-containing protein [Oceanobacillus sp. J11TS1]|uniref:MaoC/PaaZ C-terminal domain-containing protein n=1 Tax=Oceanobacillus sp. J11TS1 TaxID=2807191 RepID=UPI001B125A59|nr:MaoC/PaaZ C-terminal domain-containing protein [Oceanobacillus sp. J11TS1]GIO22555.1 MaoC family dehydratase [Oceanobacillus sp. J11TS1]
MKQIAKLTPGEKLEITLEPVTRMDLIKYSGSSGDFNPIHTVDEEAAKAGLPGIIAHGMWTMGNLSKLFTPYYEEGFIQDYKIRFSGMVFLNDVLTLSAQVDESTDEYLDFNVKATNQNGKAVIKGMVRFSKR